MTVARLLALTDGQRVDWPTGQRRGVVDRSHGGLRIVWSDGQVMDISPDDIDLDGFARELAVPPKTSHG